MRQIGARAARGAALVALAAWVAVGAARAGETAPLPRPPAAAETDPAGAAALFAMPAVAAGTRAAQALAEAGEHAAAAQVLDRLLDRHPDLGLLHANRAALSMLGGEAGAAVSGLEAAAARGFAGAAALAADPLFDPASADPALAPRLAALAAAPPPAPAAAPAPLPVSGGRAPVAAGNTAWNPARERLEPRFAFPERASGEIAPARPRTAARELLREHARRGRAAGNHGDLYDNRDRGHSTLDPAGHPQVTRVAYSAAARAADIDYGLNDVILFDRPTFGNSSTALTGGRFWRSLPRHALTRADGTGPLRLWQNAAANHLYVHPAHRDFTEEHGDLFPANTPYLLVSRGSSGSDRPFLEAVATILAAFRPDTKARLVEEGLVVPTVQMVFRRSLQPIRSREAYLGGAAHPAAFDGAAINLARMVSLANAIRPDDIPAEVRLEVLEEELGREGVDYFGAGLSEQLFDTPGAVARIWRSKAWRRSMVVSAAASRDASGRPLAFEWRLLQGDPGRVSIEPLGDGSRARITLDWHDPFRISEATPLTTARVDIGVFAHNGVHDSAPAMLSWYFPPHETRAYEPAPGGGMRIAEIDHADPARAGTYADPMLFPRADWRDSYRYAADGSPAGWTRTRESASHEYTVYTADGMQLGDDAAPVLPHYPLARRTDGTLILEEAVEFAGSG